MKITLVKEVQASNPRLEMVMCLDDVKPSIQLTLKFTCPECAGHGCRSESRELPCLNGTVSRTIEPSSLNKWFDDKTTSKIKIAFNQLNVDLNGTQYQVR